LIQNERCQCNRGYELPSRAELFGLSQAQSSK
jgi:hypothetical protein